VNEDGKEGDIVENIRRFILLSYLVRKYHQGWSFFFSEKEYWDDRYEVEDRDDGVITTQWNNLYSKFNMEKDGFQKI
jgi:hypothetical protein